jgi:hypothetical protein
MKCQCCKEEEALFAWQPFGPDGNPASYTTLGSHYRGFPVIKVGLACKTAFTSGDFEVEFVYKRTHYVGKDHQISEKIYANEAEAQAAMDRGEIVRIQVESFTADPRLLQIAQDLQDRQRLEEWKHTQEIES